MTTYNDSLNCPNCGSSNFVDYNSGKVCRDCEKRFEWIIKHGEMILRLKDTPEAEDKRRRLAKIL